MDLSLLEHLGPFLRALFQVTFLAEKNRFDSDRIKTGLIFIKEIGSGAEHNYAGSFILFRGSPMKEEWITPYEHANDRRVLLQGNTSCSRDPAIALQFALNFEGKSYTEFTPVVFVICCLNY